jgi:protease PrsW
VSSIQPDASIPADGIPLASAADAVPGPVAGPVSLPRSLRYRPRRNPFESSGLRFTLLTLLLVVCGGGILWKVEAQTGASGMVIGMSLAVVPVPLLLAAFSWLDRIEPKPLRNLVFCFAWGSCAATLVAIFANTWATDLLISHQISGGQTLGASLVAPLVEESAKGSAILLLFFFRRKDFSGIVDGVVYAGFTATGFAFTENILYLGRSVLDGRSDGLGIKVTVVTFIMREVMSPFAHPLFTSMTGVGFGVAAMTRRRWLKVLAPLGGWGVAMFLHGTWNASSLLGNFGFIGVYFLFMVPVFGLMVWLAVWSRRRELRTVGRQLPVYASAGWISPPVPLVLSSMRTRRQALDLARFTHGPGGGRTMREYLGFATSLAFLRQRAERGLADAEFTEREQELLHHLWERREQVADTLARVGEQEWQRLRQQAAQAYRFPPPGYGVPVPGGYAVPPQPGYAPPGGYPGAAQPAPGGYLPAQPAPGSGYQPYPAAYPYPYPYPYQPQPQPLPYQPHHPHPHPAPPAFAAPPPPVEPPPPPPEHHQPPAHPSH